jgi:hypothetical protein
VCHAIYRGGKCRSCGYEPTSRERRAQGLEFDGAELKEVQRKEKKPAGTRTAEELMISAIYMAGKRSRTWKQACGIYKSLNEKQGTNYYVPKTVSVGGHTYRMVPFGSEDGGRKVSALYPFTVGSHGGAYEVLHKPATTQSMF